MTEEESRAYWLGVATTMAFQQADVDTPENTGRPTLRARLPYLENPEPGDLVRFDAAINFLNEECRILYWRLYSVGPAGEYTVELASTEGYQGLPKDWREDD